MRTRCCFTGFRERIYVEGSSGYLFEKKGRGGKATIIAGFPDGMDDDDIAALASGLKQKLGQEARPEVARYLYRVIAVLT